MARVAAANVRTCATAGHELRAQQWVLYPARCGGSYPHELEVWTMSTISRVTKRERALLAQIRATRTFNVVSSLVAETTPVGKASPFARIPCAYGACDEKFLPNGRGSLMHTSCDQGRAALKAARS